MVSFTSAEPEGWSGCWLGSTLPPFHQEPVRVLGGRAVEESIAVWLDLTYWHGVLGQQETDHDHAAMMMTEDVFFFQVLNHNANDMGEPWSVLYIPSLFLSM
jgi:hypothetical protein